MAAPPDDFALSPAAFHILAPEPRHGYGIMKEVETVTAGRVRLNAGTLYTTIRRLLEDGLIRETNVPHEAGEVDERRRYYAITPEGRRLAKTELARLTALVQHAAATLRPRHTG
jgi:DNA-binding PadR family transcriptional regulator